MSAPSTFKRRTLKTYSHLASARRRPTDYDLGTSELLYHPSRGFEVDVPLGDWYRRYQRASPLFTDGGESFRDPRETTYGSYVRQQHEREAFAAGLYDWIERTHYDQQLDAAYRATLGRTLSALRFPLHGLQMVSCYIGSMAPSGRIAVTALLQAADEMRRIHCFAHRLAQLRRLGGDPEAEGRALWQEGAAWQPLRKLVEELLVAWDFGEAFVALNLVVKPVLDPLVLHLWPEVASRAGDRVLGELFHSLEPDSAWHRAWSSALWQMLALEPVAAKNRVSTVEKWIDHWSPKVSAAIEPLCAELGIDVATARAYIERERAAWYRELGLVASDRSREGA